MRTLLLFILLAAAICGAQTKGEALRLKTEWTAPGWQFKSSDTGGVRPKPDYFIFLSDFLAYAQECWDDSTLTRVHTPNAHGEACIVDWECLISSHWSMRWLHREESFSGFILWLKKHKGE